MGAYMKVRGDFLEPPGSTFIVCSSLPRGGGMNDYMKMPQTPFILFHPPVRHGWMFFLDISIRKLVYILACTRVYMAYTQAHI
ncbi:MAG: hypothetical protein D3909_03630 [Candidatus Electrothrix sp. ATG1]|nr:hypothetical protein [Candidatus Electrothrix sp. ATG1]